MVRTPTDVEGKEQETFLCPHCGVLSLQVLQKGPDGYRAGYVVEVSRGRKVNVSVLIRHLIYRCVNCQRDTYVLRRMEDKGRILSTPGVPSGGNLIVPPQTFDVPAKVLHTYPISTYARHPAVPAAVSSAMEEAEKCFAIAAYNACGVMARRAMHALCQDKGAVGKDLLAQLEDLRQKGQIAEDLWEWAEELRVIGRSGAHPEWEEVTPEDAGYAVRFLAEIVRYIYINPAERDARRLRETKKKLPRKAGP